MRVLMLSKACVVGEYQTKLVALAMQPEMQLTVVVPPAWRDERGILPLERAHLDGYELIVAPIRLNGHYHLHYFPTFAQIVARVRPDIVHLDEEPYNYATFHALQQVRRLVPSARTLFFTWQNLLRSYPPPFSWMERYVYRYADAAIAGSNEARSVLQSKGFNKPIRVIPQFGVPDTFFADPSRRANATVVIGFAGRLVEAKGVILLLHALANVRGDWQLKILGSGPLRATLEKLTRQLELETRVRFQEWIPSAEMPHFYRSLDILVAPSLTQANWKEQFGRVIMEAMACGVAVIGSSSGEIPHVIGDAGLVFPEGDVAALTAALQRLVNDPAARARLGARGSQRAREKFSQARVVAETYAFYRKLLS